MSTTGALTPAARDVLAERRRQISEEGWTPKHDDAQVQSELAFSAAVYVLNSARQSNYRSRKRKNAIIELWPWHYRWFRPTTPRRDLVKAGALILAEIERLDRATPTGDHSDE